MTPPALYPELVATLCAFPDPALCAWLATPAARDALSDRERAYLTSLTDRLGTTTAAAEIRDRLRSGGDYEIQRQRAQLVPGARVQVDRRYYTVTERAGRRNVHLTGERGGRLTICAPEVERAHWYGWIGGLYRKGARLVTLRRLDASHFVSVPAR